MCADIHTSLNGIFQLNILYLIPKHTAAVQRLEKKTSQGRICFDTTVGVVQDKEAQWGGD